MKKQIVSNVASNYALTFIGMALGFLLIPFLIGRIGNEAFGLIVLAESMTSFFEILTVSLRIAMSRQATVAQAGSDPVVFRNSLSTGHALMSGCAFLTLVAGVVVAAFFPQLFRVPVGLENASRVLALLVFVSFSLSEKNAVYWAALYAKQRFDLIHISTSAGLLLRAVAIFVIYYFLPRGGASVVPYAVVGLAMVVIQTAMVRRWHAKLLPQIRYPWEAFRKEYLRDILSFGGQFSLIRLSQVLNTNTSVLLINLWWGPAANAIYALSLKLTDIMQRVFIEPTWSLTPTLTDLAARNDKDRLERLFFSYSKVLSILSAPCCLILIFLAHSLMTLWLGAGYTEAADLLSWNALGLILGIPFCISGGLLNAYGRVRVPSVLSVLSACLNLALCFVFGRSMGMGLLGITLASLLSRIMPNLFTPFYACRVTGFSLRKYWIEVFLKPFLVSLMLCGVPLVAIRRVVTSDPQLLFVAAFLSLVSYGVAVLLLLSAEEKQLARELVVSGLARLGLKPKK